MPSFGRNGDRSGLMTAGRLPTTGLPTPGELEERADGLFRLWGVPPGTCQVVWSRRLRTSAGRAHLRHHRIHLNPRLLARHPQAVAEVLAHEAAHVAAHHQLARLPREWKQLTRKA